MKFTTPPPFPRCSQSWPLGSCDFACETSSALDTRRSGQSHWYNVQYLAVDGGWTPWGAALVHFARALQVFSEFD